MPTVLKSVIPAAGFGTRMLPAGKSVAKELLPILDRPTIQYVVEEAAAAGISDVLLVTSREKKALEDHFDRNPELEARLASSGKPHLLASINQLMTKVKVHSVRQSEQLGLGHAVLQARRHVGNEPFLCQLGDAVFLGSPPPALQLVEAFQKYQTPVIGLEEVPLEKVSRYGIVGGNFLEEHVLKINALVEKPPAASAPSRYAIAARYVLTPEIFDCLDRTTPGAGGEIQLTDALQLLLAKGPIHGVILRANRFDIGNPVDWLRTNIAFARRDEKIWPQIAPLLQELM